MTNEIMEQYREFVGKLHIQEERTNVLNDLKSLLVFKPAREAATAIRNVGITKIIHCLNVHDKNQVELTCDLIKICFMKFEVGDAVKNYTSIFMYLLRHDKECVRRLAVEEIYKTVIVDPNLLPIPIYIDVFVAVAQLVSDQSISVASKAIQVTSNLAPEAYPKVLEEMKIILEYNSSCKCNVFEVIINISAKSYDLFKLSADMNYIDFMVSELQSDDVLFQLNILELLSRLVVTPHGINYIVKQGAMKTISELVKDFKNNPLAGLLTPGYMKFFGCIAHHYPREIFDKFPILLDLLFEAFESKDLTILPVALDTLGFIGVTVEGKLCLAAIGSKYTQAVEKVGQVIRNSVTDIKVRALHCFASLISIDKDPNVSGSVPVDHRVTLMTREWFRSLSASPTSMETLFGICKNPFPEIRLAAFTLLDAVCQHQWGIELVARVAGFIEYLLDRTVDHSKESKEAKFEIITKLSKSLIFDDVMLTRLQTYVAQGPFFIETMMEVGMEDGD